MWWDAKLPLLNKLGEEGWELCAAYNSMFYFKRLLP